jgi:hypothetical protein
LPQLTVQLARIDDDHPCSPLPSEMKSGPPQSSRTEECQDKKVQVKMEEDEEPEPALVEIKLDQLKASEIEHLIQGVFRKKPSTSTDTQTQWRVCSSVNDSRNKSNASKDKIPLRTTRSARNAVGTSASRGKYFEPNSSGDDEKEAVVLKRDVPKRRKKNHDEDFKTESLRCSSSETSGEEDDDYDEELFEKCDANYDKGDNQDRSPYRSKRSRLPRAKKDPRKRIRRHKLGSDEPIPCFLCQIEFGDYEEYDAVRIIIAYGLCVLHV